MAPARRLAFFLLVPLLLGLITPGSAAACGGLFCTNVPVDQSAERIIFTMDEGQIGTYVQINYTGSPADFAWVLPVPSVPTLATADMATFRDLDRMTAPLYIPPRAPDCVLRRMPMPAAAAPSAPGVDVLASGTVGPFDYVVVTSPDPAEMVRWLRDNSYRIEPEMEPLVKAYTDDGMVFLAMKLHPGKNTQDIVPIKLDYASTQPMIPLRLTAVAAQPNMGVLTWIFANGRTAPLNYVDMTISDGEVAFNPFGNNNYRQVVVQAKDQAGGRAFVTEFAGPTTSLRASDPTAQRLIQQYPYLTRFYTRISPDQMTVDPIFDYAPAKGDVSNTHDLSKLPSPFDCTDDFSTFKTIPGAGAPPSVAGFQRDLERLDSSGLGRGGLLALVLIAGAWIALRGTSRTSPGTGHTIRGAGPRARLARHTTWGLRRVTARAGRLLLLEALLVQGFHEVEHVVQVVQRSVLDIRLGSGLLGSVFDVEPVHFIYNLTFLGLLMGAYVGLRRSNAIPRNGSLVLGLLTFAVIGQGYHAIEHVVKMIQFLETGRNGTPGMLGNWLNVVWLHFWFNTVLGAPVVAAFFVGRFDRALGRDLGELLPRITRPGRANPGGQPA